MTEWRVQYFDGFDNNGNRIFTTEPDLMDLNIVTNANPYGDSGTAYISSVDGNRIEDYPPRQRVKFQAKESGSGNSYTTVLDGYVVEPRERTDDGANRLEVSVYSLDQLLRNGDMNGDLSGLSIKNALKELIENWVDGVNWTNPDPNITDLSERVQVQNDVNLNRSYQNELVDNIIKSLRRRSAGEEFGVDSNFNFYFRPAETSTTDRGIGPGDWNNYELPEKAEDALNEVRVFYDDGDRAVIVDDTGDKREIEENLGAPEPVTQAESIMRKQITTRADAVAAGEEYLTDRGVPKEIQVETYGLLDANPGDTIDITIPSAGINDEYRIAQLEYTMPDGTTVTALREDDLVQKSESATSDMLVRASDSLQRVEMRPARQDSDLEETVRVIETLVGVDVGIGGDVDGVQFDTFAITNTGWDQLITAYLDKSTIDITQIIVGTNGDSAQRTDDNSITSQSGSETATVTTSGSFDVDITNGTDFSTGDTVREVGLKDGSGNLLLRATLVNGVTDPKSANVTLSVSNDTSIDNGIVTETGQTLVRDILADNSPVPPKDFAVGDTDPTNQGSSYDDETRTSLSATNNANTTKSRDLGVKIIDDVDSTNGLVSITDSAFGALNTGGVTIVDDTIELDQAAWVFEAESDDLHDPANETTDGKFTDSTAVNFAGRDEDVMQFSFESNREIENASIAWFAIANSASTQELGITFNGSYIQPNVSTSLEWQYVKSLPVSIQEGSNTLTIGSNSTNNTDLDIDVLAVYDADNVTGSPSTWDDDNGGSGGYLEEPQLYPDQKLVKLGETNSSGVKVAQPVEQLDVALGMNNTENNQYIEIDGIKTHNNTTASTAISPADDVIPVTLSLSNSSSNTGPTPTTGDGGQVISSIQLTTGSAKIGSEVGSRSLNLTSYFGPGVIAANTNIKEAGVRDKNQKTISYSDVSFTSESDLTISLAETLRFRREALAVNESDFDVSITDLNGVDSSSAYYQVDITDTDTTA